MLLISPWLFGDSVLPHVRDPLPHSIGLGFPLALSGAFSMLAEILKAEVPPSQRDRFISRAGIYGFVIGAALYLLALLDQLLFQL
jgi:hypothetical protein